MKIKCVKDLHIEMIRGVTKLMCILTKCTFSSSVILQALTLSSLIIWANVEIVSGVVGIAIALQAIGHCWVTIIFINTCITVMSSCVITAINTFSSFWVTGGCMTIALARFAIGIIPESCGARAFLCIAFFLFHYISLALISSMSSFLFKGPDS